MDCYLLNTDAKSMPDGRSPHGKWFEHGMVFCAEDTWGISKHKDMNHYGRNFTKLKPKDICLMYVNDIGVVGVGEVIEEYDGKSYSGTEWLVYGPGANGFGTEHRIRVNWYKDLRNNPISYNKLMSIGIIPNSAFKHIVSSKERILELISRVPDLGK